MGLLKLSVFVILFFCLVSVSTSTLTSSTSSSSSFNKYFTSVSTFHSPDNNTQILIIDPWNSTEEKIDVIFNITLNIGVVTIFDVLSFDETTNILLIIGSDYIGNSKLIQVDVGLKEFSYLGGEIYVNSTFAWSLQRLTYIEQSKTVYLAGFVLPWGSSRFIPTSIAFDFSIDQIQETIIGLPNVLTQSTQLWIQTFNSNDQLMYAVYLTKDQTINLVTYELDNPNKTLSVYQDIQNVNLNIDMVFSDVDGNVYLIYDNSSIVPGQSNLPLELTVCKIQLESGNKVSCLYEYTTIVGHPSTFANYYLPFVLSQDRTQLLFITSEQDYIQLEFVSIGSNFQQDKVVKIPNEWNNYSFLFKTIFSF